MSNISNLLKDKAEDFRKEAQVKLVKEAAVKTLVEGGMKKSAAEQLISKRLG
jgi:hypothetical protein